MASSLDLDKQIDFLAKYQSQPLAEKFGPPTPYEFYKAGTKAVMGRAPLDEFAFRRMNPDDQTETIRYYHLQVVEREKEDLNTLLKLREAADLHDAAVAAQKRREAHEYGLEERLGAW